MTGQASLEIGVMTDGTYRMYLQMTSRKGVSRHIPLDIDEARKLAVEITKVADELEMNLELKREENRENG